MPFSYTTRQRSLAFLLILSLFLQSCLDLGVPSVPPVDPVQMANNRALVNTQEPKNKLAKEGCSKIAKQKQQAIILKQEVTTRPMTSPSTELEQSDEQPEQVLLTTLGDDEPAQSMLPLTGLPSYAPTKPLPEVWVKTSKSTSSKRPLKPLHSLVNQKALQVSQDSASKNRTAKNNQTTKQLLNKTLIAKGGHQVRLYQEADEFEP